MQADCIVRRIGQGVRDALKTNKLFLGVEAGPFENADIHPEYITTVEVGKALIAPDHVVSLEAQMKQLRAHARKLALLKSACKKSACKKNDHKKIDTALAPYVFGKRDSQRLDVLVLNSDTISPPILMAEAKLGGRNLLGVLCDIDRIVRLLDMFKAVDVLNDSTYGAVVFHFMEEGPFDDEGRITGAAQVCAEPLLTGVRAHSTIQQSTRPWLKAKVGLIASAGIIEPTSGYLEDHDDGTSQNVFAKHGFRFVPGLVLLGLASDVDTVSF